MAGGKNQTGSELGRERLIGEVGYRDARYLKTKITKGTWIQIILLIKMSWA